MSLIGRPPTDPVERFWRFVDRGTAWECWDWMGGKVKGYGYFGVVQPRRLVKAHRFAYELLVGPIPPGLTLDHLCRNHACVNPAHLEPVTLSENVARSNRARAGESRPSRHKAVCNYGHPMEGENIGIAREGYRYCRTCNRDRARGRKQALRAA